MAYLVANWSIIKNMQIEYDIWPFIFLGVLLCIALMGIHLIRGKSIYSLFGKSKKECIASIRQLKAKRQNIGKIILGICVCVAVPLTMDSVVCISPKVITLNGYAWSFYFLLSIITVLCSGALVSLYKTK